MKRLTEDRLTAEKVAAELRPKITELRKSLCENITSLDYLLKIVGAHRRVEDGTKEWRQECSKVDQLEKVKHCLESCERILCLAK